jgi:hypothetical protein
MIGVLLLLTGLLLLATIPAHAIPTCMFGTMEDYLALTGGCRIGVLTVSDFVYLGVRENPVFTEDIPPNFVSVAPSQPYGPSGMRLSFDGPYNFFNIGFTVHAEGPWIQQYALFLFGGFNQAFISANGLSISVPEGEFIAPGTSLSARRSFPPIAGEFAFGAVTPEPTTLLLWAAGATGLGLARWRGLRKRGNHAA